MAGTELSVPSEQFTKIKAWELMPPKALEVVQEEGACRGREHLGPGNVEAQGTYGLLEAKMLEGERGLVLTTEESEKHIVTLQTVHFSYEDVQLQDVGWLTPQGREGVQGAVRQASGGEQSLLWLDEGSQQCVAISIQEEAYTLQELEVMQLHVLEGSVAVASEDTKFVVSLAESTGWVKVRPVLINRPCT